jgi:hypothetical protein
VNINFKNIFQQFKKQQEKPCDASLLAALKDCNCLLLKLAKILVSTVL